MNEIKMKPAGGRLWVTLVAAGLALSCTTKKNEEAQQPLPAYQPVQAVAPQPARDSTSLPIVLRRAARYSADLAQYESQKGRQPLEPFFQQGESAAAPLMSVLDIFKEEYVQFAKNNMRGYLVNRDEVAYVVPDLGFFRELAERRGEKADVTFFRLMAQTRPDNFWPVYLTHKGNTEGCVRFGDGTLVDLYDKWWAFRTEHPNAYVKQRDAMLQMIGLDLATSVCACGSMEKVLKEYRRFIARFPQSAVTPQLQKRMEDMQRKTDPMQFNCTDGQH